VSKLKRSVPRLALTQQEAAEALGMSVTHFAENVKPSLPVVLSGALKLYPIWALEDWMHENAVLAGRRVA
jgi:hypothetical protein